MIKNAKKVISSKVYDEETGNYLGRISDIAFSEGGKIEGFFMATDSIVPLDIWICPGAVRARRGRKMIVGGDLGEAEKGLKTFGKDIKGRKFLRFGRKIGKGRDMIFDAETGEIQNFVYAENIFRPAKEVDANKIKINGKTIDIKE